MTSIAKFIESNDLVKKKITLSKDITFNKWKIGYHHLLFSIIIQKDILLILDHNLDFNNDFSHNPLIKSNNLKNQELMTIT
jgi:hypothetical protein